MSDLLHPSTFLSNTRLQISRQASTNSFPAQTLVSPSSSSSLSFSAAASSLVSFLATAANGTVTFGGQPSLFDSTGNRLTFGVATPRSDPAVGNSIRIATQPPSPVVPNSSFPARFGATCTSGSVCGSGVVRPSSVSQQLCSTPVYKSSASQPVLELVGTSQHSMVDVLPR